MAKRRLQKGKKATATTKSVAAAGSARKKRTVSVKDPAGSKRRRLRVELPRGATAAEQLEAEHFVRVLDANEQLARQPGPLPPGATHQLETDRSGAKRVVRKRFSAL
jgi:hypothetical protein